MLNLKTALGMGALALALAGCQGMGYDDKNIPKPYYDAVLQSAHHHDHGATQNHWHTRTWHTDHQQGVQNSLNPIAPIKAQAQPAPKPAKAKPAHQYTCEKDVRVAITQGDLDTINAVVNLPQGFNPDTVSLVLQIAPSASGERYINDSNPDSTFEWHQKGDMGMLTLGAVNQEFTYSCTR